MPGRAYLVHGAITLIAMPFLFAYGYAGKVIVTGNAWFRSQRQHDLLPFIAVRPYPGCSKKPVNDIMGDFVRYSGSQVVIEIFGKNIGVVANYTVIIVHFIHTGRTAFEIEMDRDQRELPVEQITGTYYSVVCAGANLILLTVIDRFNGIFSLGLYHWRN